MADDFDFGSIERAPFCAVLGIKIESAADGEARVRMPFRAQPAQRGWPAGPDSRRRDSFADRHHGVDRAVDRARLAAYRDYQPEHQLSERRRAQRLDCVRATAQARTPHRQPQRRGRRRSGSTNRGRVGDVSDQIACQVSRRGRFAGPLAAAGEVPALGRSVHRRASFFMRRKNRRAHTNSVPRIARPDRNNDNRRTGQYNHRNARAPALSRPPPPPQFCAPCETRSTRWSCLVALSWGGLEVFTALYVNLQLGERIGKRSREGAARSRRRHRRLNGRAVRVFE